MNNKPSIFGIIVAAAAAAIIGFAANNRDTKNNVKDEIVMKKDPLTTTASSGQSEDAMGKKEETMVAKHGSYKDYSETTVDAEFKAGNKVILFFHAPWCPFCKTANTAFSPQTDQIPSGVTVLKTDYDSNTELKKKYGVTYQHTFVQIDAQGNQVTKWSGGDIENLRKYVK